MTIARGADWGRAGCLPPGAPLASDDAAVARLAARSGPGQRPVVGLLGGDLCRTLGGPRGEADLRRADGAWVADVDVGLAFFDDEDDHDDEDDATAGHRFVAHLVARRAGWMGPFLVVMNAEWLGEWKAGPRAHPADGLLDLTAGSLPWRQRLQARARARTGDHLPHPALRTWRASSAEYRFDTPVGIWLDGVRLAGRRVRSLRVSLSPDALTVVV